MGMIILGVVVLLFLLLAYQSTRTWPVWHVVLLFGLFLATIGFSFLAAATLKTQRRWRVEYNTLQASLEREREMNETLKQGRRFGETVQPGIREIRGDVDRALVDRGRVWRNLAVQEIGEGTITLDPTNWGDEACVRVGTSMMAEEPLEPLEETEEGEAAAEVRPLGLTAGTIVYAFKEVPLRALSAAHQQILLGESNLAGDDEQGVCKVAGFYMGEYKVTSSPDDPDGATLTLEPNLPLTNTQIEQLEDPAATWVLYEVMPRDAHEPFEPLSEEQLQVLFPPEQMNLSAEEYQDFLSKYARDLEAANPTDPPERTWVRVRFLQPYEVDIDLQESVSLPDQLFDARGRSLAAILKQEGKTQFARGDEALLDSQTARTLINQGVAEEIGRVFVRSLRDYAHLFRAVHRGIQELETQIQVAQNDLQSLQTSIEKLSQQIAFRTEEREKLAEDRQGFERERKIITEYLASLESHWDQMRRELSRLYRSNQQMVDRLRSQASRQSQAEVREQVAAAD